MSNGTVKHTAVGHWSFVTCPSWWALASKSQQMVAPTVLRIAEQTVTYLASVLHMDYDGTVIIVDRDTIIHAYIRTSMY